MEVERSVVSVFPYPLFKAVPCMVLIIQFAERGNGYYSHIRSSKDCLNEYNQLFPQQRPQKLNVNNEAFIQILKLVIIMVF